MTEQYEQQTLFDVSKYEKLDGSGNVTYNHMFDIAFAVPDSEYADGFRQVGAAGARCRWLVWLVQRQGLERLDDVRSWRVECE